MHGVVMWLCVVRCNMTLWLFFSAVDYQAVLALGVQSNGTPDSSASSETSTAAKAVVVSSTTKDTDSEQ